MLILRPWFLFLLTPICAVGCLVLAIQFFAQATWVKVPGQVMAKQVKIKTLHRRHGEVEIPSLLISFTYKVNGVQYIITEDFRAAHLIKEKFNIGEPVDIYYEPGNPKNAAMGNCNSGKLGCVALSASIISALGFLFGLVVRKQLSRNAY